MNIQLFLENQEVELSTKASFPMNKVFENLFNPTDVIVPYSKSINIPATKRNNALMANAYRLDKKFAINEGEYPNIGMYLDPLKRIPMKLIHNGTLLLDGYAKYNSATVNNKETYYTFNLHGVLGDIFQKLIDCVFDENKLTDEQRAEADKGAKYIINTPWSKDIINKEFVEQSWKNYDRKSLSSSSPFKYIGMAPANRGFYDNFSSDNYYGYYMDLLTDGVSEYKTGTVEEYLKMNWCNNIKSRTGNTLTDDEIRDRVDGIDIELILKDGSFTEQMMNQYRSYEQKPFIYFDSLMKLYQAKCKELTGYDIKLDSRWFNQKNPYWSKLCYMLDYLSVKGNTLDSSYSFTGYNNSTWDVGTTSTLPSTAVTYNISDVSVLSMNNLEIKPFTLCLSNTVLKRAFDSIDSVDLKFANDCAVVVDIVTTVGSTTKHKYYWAGKDYTTVSKINPDILHLGADNFITLSEVVTKNRENNTVTNDTYITIPAFSIEHSAGASVSITYNVSIYRTYSRLKGPYAYIYNGEQINSITPIAGNEDFKVTIPNTTISTNWRTTTTCDMRNLYTKDDSLFRVILQYTKMFGLIWDVDYNSKEINILTRKSYFDNYTIVDWTNKVDKSKGLTIEPVSFNSQYVTFNYKDISGYRYSGYKNKYGVKYGEKKLKTKYNFDRNNLELFKNDNIQPSSISANTYYSLLQLVQWDTYSKLEKEYFRDLIDCEDDEQTKSISINNWYFRDANSTLDAYFAITDASKMELEEDKYYWIEPLSAIQNSILINEFPTFTPVYKSEYDNKYYGCLFNCPNEDYTRTKNITNAKGNYIYDLCWSDYVNERYNANNKKVTCYIKLTPIEFKQFNFKNFIVIDNQLFTINKIVDYDPNNIVTKIELIQITDVNGYMNTNFDFGDTPDAPDVDDPDTPDTPEEPEVEVAGSSKDNPIYLDFQIVDSDVYNKDGEHRGKLFVALVATTNEGKERLIDTYDINQSLTGELRIGAFYTTVNIENGTSFEKFAIYELGDAINDEPVWTSAMHGGASADTLFEDSGVWYCINSLDGISNRLETMEKCDSVTKYISTVVLGQ